MTTLTDRQLLVLRSLIGGILAPVDKNVCANLSIDAGDSAVVAQTTPANLATFDKHVDIVFRSLPDQTRNDLLRALNILSFTPLAILITRSPQSLMSMRPEQICNIITSWIYSPIPLLGALGRSLRGLAVLLLTSDPVVLQAIGYVNPHPELAAVLEAPVWQPSVIDTVDDVDVVIVGSGCSAGVLARRLTYSGWRVLIVEKGDFADPRSLSSDILEANSKAYDSSGILYSHDSSTIVVAGSTLGGGGAVNWSCCLRPPQAIRDEFRRMGAPLFSSSEYDESLRVIDDVMKTTEDVGRPHSFTNQLILDSAHKLGFQAKVTGQNTGSHLPNSHFLGTGHRYGDKGGIVNWLKDACDRGAKVMTGTEAIRIIHGNGKAHGVELFTKNSEKLRIRCKRVAVCAGALHTPLLLRRSGFTNKNIGKHLKLHPVTVVYGEFDTTVNKRTDTIMTAVCTEADNLDGQHHGPKIEAIHHAPFFHMNFLPWRNSPEDLKSLCARYQRLSSLLVITRDRDHGEVYYNPKEPNRPFIYYSPSKYDRWALLQGSLTAADFHYVGGSQCIVMPNGLVPAFSPSVPPSKRHLSDPDYLAWREKASKVPMDKHNTAFGSAHQMGTCRMSVDGPQQGAVDGKGRLWECSDVYVADTSIFPAASGVNPMYTCLAAAHIIAGRIEHDLGAARL